MIYGPTGVKVEIDDRTLAHVKLVVLMKLRRGESFAFSWEKGPERGSGRGTIWLNPSIGLEFQFDGSRQAALNGVWLEDLMVSANSAGGLHLVPEPERTPATEVPPVY